MNRGKQSTEQSSNQRRWQAHVIQQVKSGFNRAEYCRRNHLSYHALTYWQKKLSKHQQTTRQALVPVTLENNRLLKSTDQQTSIKIILPGQVTIEIGDDFLQGTLRRVLDTFEARRCCR